MGNQNDNSFAGFPRIQSSLDTPRPGANVYDSGIFISGWVFAAGNDPASCRVRAYVDNVCIAETAILSVRREVCAALGIAANITTGFKMLGRVPNARGETGEARLRITASWADLEETKIHETKVQLIPALLRQRPYGEVLYPENETLLHRENIYGSGPPIEEPGTEVENLLREYLPERCSVLDVGCGAGAYGPELISTGHNWLGLEANAHCCEILLRRQLPFRRVNIGAALPCGDGEWDSAICIEVLEHVKAPEIFIREIARSIRGRALFSVPNMEVIPYFHDWRVVPWHLLEGDHRNFFTRASLRKLLAQFFRRVEIFSYGEHSLRTHGEVPLHIHQFAVADK